MGLKGKLRIQIKIRPDLNVQDWKLNTTNLDESIKVVQLLNSILSLQFNMGATREHTHSEVLIIMAKYQHVGALNSGPRAVLEELLDILFPVS